MPLTFDDVNRLTKRQWDGLLDWTLDYNHIGVYLLRKPGMSLRVEFDAPNDTVRVHVREGRKVVGRYAGVAADLDGFHEFCKDFA